MWNTFFCISELNMNSFYKVHWNWLFLFRFLQPAWMHGIIRFCFHFIVIFNMHLKYVRETFKNVHCYVPNFVIILLSLSLFFLLADIAFKGKMGIASKRLNIIITSVNIKNIFTKEFAQEMKLSNLCASRQQNYKYLIIKLEPLFSQLQN